jgi:hypothetical protein
VANASIPDIHGRDCITLLRFSVASFQPGEFDLMTARHARLSVQTLHLSCSHDTGRVTVYHTRTINETHFTTYHVQAVIHFVTPRLYKFSS